MRILLKKMKPVVPSFILGGIVFCTFLVLALV